MTAPFVAMSMAMILGVAGLGTEVGTWYVAKRSMQGAADAAAYSAAVAAGANASYQSDGTAVAASFGYVNGANGVTVAINNPPTAGAYAGLASAYEAVITQPQTQLFTKLFTATPTTVKARAVASSTAQPVPCITTLGTQNGAGVTLNGHVTVSLGNCNLVDQATGADSLTMNGNSTLSAGQVSLGGGERSVGQSTLTTTNGLLTDQAANPNANPLLSREAGINNSVPASCDYTDTSLHGTTTINPGKYCNGIVVLAATVTLNPGVYYINDGSFTVNGNSTVTGSGVTIVFTSDNGTYGTFTVNGSGSVTLTAPTSGLTAGLVFYESSSAPTNTVTFNGGNNLNLTGAVYFPSQNLKYNGQGNSTCSLIYANTITFNGNANFGGNCNGIAGLPQNGNAITKLVE